MRVGVFVCHCGNNIAGTVDVAKVAEETRKLPGVVYSTDYMYTCSEPGQEDTLKDATENTLVTMRVMTSKGEEGEVAAGT